MTARNRTGTVLTFATVVMAILGMATNSASAGTISYVLITNDADCGISADNTYTHTLDFGTGTPGALINGVQFNAYNNAANGTLNFDRQATSGNLSHHAGNGNHNVSGSLVALLTDMYYNGSNAVGGSTTWTLSGLTAGQTYQTRIYTRRWGANNDRTATIVFDPDGAGPVSDSTGPINQDDATTIGFANGNDAYYINYEFPAVAGQNLVITATQNLSNQSWHLYGLTNQEFSPESAYSPNPDDGATDVPRDSGLSWAAGIYAAKHDVYMGESLDQVDAATVPTAPGLDVTSYDPGRLELGKTYFWRVDEVNAPPTSNVVFKGDVWSFTVEPVGYPIDGANITATASSSMNDDSGPQKTIDGSGLDDSDLHSTDLSDMWLSNIAGPQPTWIEYQFDKVYKLHEMQIWNQNQLLEPAIGYGFKDVTIEYSLDGIDYTTLGTAHEFARAPGLAGYAADTAVDFGGVVAKYVKLTANSNWGSILTQYGLSEVRFLYVPVSAKEPSPDSGATDVAVDAPLTWRAGREAATHDVYLDADEQAVIDGTVGAVGVPDASHTSAFDLGTTYYWRIDEVNDAETPATWQGDVWNFTTQEFIVVDDFESYNDVEAGQEGSNLVYDTWADGFGIPANGSTMGYDVPFEPTMESTIVHGGRQSAPMAYDNTAAALSEVTRTLASQDWTKHGVQTLTLWFHGASGNTGQLYVKINGAKVAYDGAASDIALAQWQTWNIDLASAGGNMQNVTELAIGVDGAGASGTLLIDDIRLYAWAGELIIPVDPGNADLAGAWNFDAGSGSVIADSSGNGNNGAAIGGPTWVAGPMGSGALSFDGIDDMVEIPDDPSLDIEDTLTISTWVNLTDISVNCFFVVKQPSGTAPDNYPGNYELRTEIATGRLQLGHQWATGTQYVFYTSDGAVSVGEWQHVAVTLAEGDVVRFYINAIPAGTAAQTQPFGILNDNSVRIGTRKDEYRYLNGMMDDVRIYERVLSAEEIAGLAGRTAPMHKAF